MLVAGKRVKNAKKKLTELKDCCDNGDEECWKQIDKYNLEYTIAKAVADMAQQEFMNSYQNTQEGKLMDACIGCIVQREYEILKLS